MRLAALALLLSACIPEQPSNAEVDAPPHVDEAVEVALTEWSDALGVGPLSPADVPPIRWFEGPCLDYGDRCDFGHLSWSAFEQEIHLVIRPTIAESSLVHELLHWSLHETRGYYDGSHSAEAWANVDKVRDVLAYLEL